MARKTFYGRYYDASWSIPDEDDEYLWEIRQQQAERNNERLEEIRDIADARLQDNLA